MKIIVVYIEKMRNAPPVASFIKVLLDLGNEVVLCTIHEGSQTYGKLINSKGIHIEYVAEDYKDNDNLLEKYIRLLKIRRRLWKIIDKEYSSDSLIVAVTDVSIKHLGKKLLQKKYVLYMLELLEGVYYVPKWKLFKINVHKYALYAKAVIEAEYNRAHITKAWWGLKKLPYVLPNKPYFTEDIDKISDKVIGNFPLKFYELLDKKIIIYQGIINNERPLQNYYNAVKKLGEDYALIVMGSGGNPFPNADNPNYLYIPYVEPPYHLQITRHAYIGLLSYTPVKNVNSILNVLYCAPNKIWEYSRFGVPVLSNDLPALNSVYNEFHNGLCVKEDEESIYHGLKQISDNYSEYSKSAIKFYNSIDLKAICKQMLIDINKETN